jgi:hypothetical protein
MPSFRPGLETGDLESLGKWHFIGRNFRENILISIYLIKYSYFKKLHFYLLLFFEK